MPSAESNNPIDAGPAGPVARRTDFDSVRPAGRRCLTCGREGEPGQTLNAVLIELPRLPSPPSRPGAGGHGPGGDFQRLDYCPACWASSPWSQEDRLLDEGQSADATGLYGAAPVATWTARVAPRDRPKRGFVDDTVLTQFFLRLADDPAPQHQQFRFVLMLILMRHRKLRHERTERMGRAGRPAASGAEPSPGPADGQPAGDVWLVRLSPAMAEATGTPPDRIHRVADPQLGESQVQQVAEQLSQILQEDIDAGQGGLP